MNGACDLGCREERRAEETLKIGGNKYSDSPQGHESAVIN